MINFYISAFLTDFALGAVLLSLPLLLIYKFGATSLILGLFGALGSLIYFSGVITAGRLSDRFNRRNIIMLGCSLFILVYLITPFLNRINQVFFIYVLGAISMSMFWPTIQSWLSQGLNKETLMKSLTNFNVYWSTGLTLGFLVAGFLFSINMRAPFFFGICLVSVVVPILRKQPVPSEMRDGPARKVFLETEKEKPGSTKRFLHISWCANFVSWYILGMVRNLFPKLGTELGFSTRAIGVLIFSMMLAQTIMFFILGRTHKWHYRLSPILLFQSLAILALVAMAIFSQTYYFIAAMIFLGLSSGMTYFSSLFYSLYGFLDKGKKSGIHEGFIGIGALLGPLIGGFSAHSLGIRSPYVIAALLLVIAIVVEFTFYRKALV